MGEQKKPSSLRTRVDRARKAYDKPTKAGPIIIGAVFVIVCGVVLVFAFREPPASYSGRSTDSDEAPAPQPAPASESKPVKPKLSANPRQAVMQIVTDAKQTARKNADAAMKDLEQALAKYPQYTPTIYRGMGMVIEQKIVKSGGSNAPRRLLQQKLDYFLKAKDELDAGKEWAFDPIKNSTANLNSSIEQAEKEVNR